jgi:hypothetical protein
MRMTNKLKLVMGGLLLSSTALADQPPGDISHSGLDVDFIQGDGTDLSCPAPTACFQVTADKNITHIFVDANFDCESGADPGILQVTVDGTVIPQSKWHTNGGPCNHGEDFIPRDIWFPLPGNQKSAEVCVTTFGMSPSDVSVGAKAAEECLYDTAYGTCEVCEQKPPCDP